MERIKIIEMKEGKNKLIYIFYILFLIIFLFITSKIEISVNNFLFSSENKNHINNGYIFKIKLCILKIIPIFKISITKDKIRKILKNKKIQEKIEKQKIKIVNDTNNIDIKMLKLFKNIKLDIEKIKLNISVGTEDAALTAFIAPFMANALIMLLRKKIKKDKKNQELYVEPVFNNKNILEISFSGIFKIKMIHIINTICIVNKKKGDKNERTSNRRSYDYGYE